MTKEEYKELLMLIQTTITMAEVSREAQQEAREVVGKELVKKIKKTRGDK